MYFRLQIIIVLFITLFGISVLSAHNMPRIFILHSYEKNHVCGQPQHDGVISALKKAGFESGKKVIIQTYHMDTKRKNNNHELMKLQADIALKQIHEFKPDILITLDDNAFRTVGLKLADTDTAIVFCGLNSQIQDYNEHKVIVNSKQKPGHNITGVYEKLHIADAFRVHCKIFPDLKEIMIFTDESPTGRAVYKQIQLELKNETKLPCKWKIKVIKNWDEYKAAIHAVNNNPEIGAIYPAAVLLKDIKSNTYTAPEIFNWTINFSKKPEIALNYAFTKLGLFGGAAVDFHAMGEQCGSMAVMILKGKNPGNIAIEDASRYALTFNLKRASQLGIKIPHEIIMAADEVIKE